jgi:hypothetical protein
MAGVRIARLLNLRVRVLAMRFLHRNNQHHSAHKPKNKQKAIAPMMQSQTAIQQQTPEKSSFCDTMIFVVVLFGLPIPFVLLVPVLHRSTLHYPLGSVFCGYSLLVIAFVKIATAIIRWTAQAIVSKQETEGTLPYMMTPLLLVAFPQWILFLATILTALNSDAIGVEAGSGFIFLASLVTICIPLLVILRTFQNALKTIDVEQERQNTIQKQEEKTQKTLALTHNVRAKKFNGVTSCLKIKKQGAYAQ